LKNTRALSFANKVNLIRYPYQHVKKDSFDVGQENFYAQSSTFLPTFYLFDEIVSIELTRMTNWRFLDKSKSFQTASNGGLDFQQKKLCTQHCYY
jgi:hypothetical protein